MLLLETRTPSDAQSNMYLIDTLIDEISSHIDESITSALQSKSICKKLYNTCGDKAFLVPESLSLPIMNPKTCEIDKKLLYKSYLEAIKYSGVKPGYRDAAGKAKTLLRETDGDEICLQVAEVDSYFDIITFLEILGLSK